MHKRIVILGDSLSMPRPDDGITYNETYAYLLYDKGYEVINRSRRANNTSIQAKTQNILDDIIFLDPTSIVIFLGITDCAPRMFTKKETLVLGIFPNFLRKIIIGFFSKHRYFITKLRKITYVSRVNFKKNMNTIIKHAVEKNCQIILCTIPETNKTNIERSFNFKENIEMYNETIKKISNKYNLSLVETQKCSDGLLEDGIHITKNMHHFIFQEIHKVLKS